MSQRISLKKIEQKAFSATYDDGLWDVFLGCFILIFAIAPYLSTRLGDFWSSAVFLPFWGIVFLTLKLVRKYVVTPRVGIVKLGRTRKTRLTKLSTVLLVVNAVAFILGLVAAMNFERVPGQMFTITFSLLFLAGFSTVAYFLQFHRLYIYGILVGLSPLIGEWLHIHFTAPHHGFPITFGTTAGIMVLIGLIVFVRLVRNTPIPSEANSSERVGNGQTTD